MVGRIDRETGIDDKARSFSVLSHLSAMRFAQLTHAIGLNDVCASMPNGAQERISARTVGSPARMLAPNRFHRLKSQSLSCSGRTSLHTGIVKPSSVLRSVVLAYYRTWVFPKLPRAALGILFAYNQDHTRMTLKKIRNIALLLSVILPSCNTVETIPLVNVHPNESGIEVTSTEPHGPKNLLGGTLPGEVVARPDTPSGVIVEVRRLNTLHNKEPRYFIAASGDFQVVSVERADSYKLSDLGSELKRWQTIIASEDHNELSRDAHYASRALDEIPWINAARCFHAKLRFKTFPWGNAVMFLTSYVQGSTGGPVNNDMLVLVVQGLTSDGRYAFNGHFEIRHPKLPESLWDTRHKAKKVYFSIDDDTDAAERWLNAQDDNSFAPTFAQYEKFLAAIQIMPGKPYSNKDEQIMAGKSE